MLQQKQCSKLQAGDYNAEPSFRKFSQLATIASQARSSHKDLYLWSVFGAGTIANRVHLQKSSHMVCHAWSITLRLQHLKPTISSQFRLIDN
jgi:hypothetical protein